MNLLMISGASDAVKGQQGPHYQMLRYWSQHWDRIDILTLGGPGVILHPDASPRTLFGNVHLYPNPGGRLSYLSFIRRQGRALLAERDYDLVTSHDYGFFYTGLGTYLLLRGTGIPYVSEIHHVEGYPLAATAKERVYRALAMLYLRWVWKHAAAIRAVNHEEIPELLRRLGVPGEKILVLPSLYLDYDVWQPEAGTEKRYDLLFVGRLVPNKGLFTILDALAQVKQTHPAVTLAIRGDGPLLADLQKRITALSLTDNVVWLPRQTDAEALAALYRAARAVVCASTAEGGPRVTVEAMACGTPVISTPVGMMRELLVDGENGLLFHWDAGELARQITRLLDDPALQTRLGAAGQKAAQGFDAATVIATYAQGYHDLVRRLSQPG